MGGVDWTRILREAGIPESPGYERTQELMRQRRLEVAAQQRQATQELMQRSAAAAAKAKPKRRARR